MKNTKNMKQLIARAKESRLGRFLCRIAGDENGAVMMEYVIVATLIAAAVALGVWLFGSTILGMFQTSAEATSGKHDGAAEHAEKIRENTAEQNKEGQQMDDRYTDKSDASGAKF